VCSPRPLFSYQQQQNLQAQEQNKEATEVGHGLRAVSAGKADDIHQKHLHKGVGDAAGSLLKSAHVARGTVMWATQQTFSTSRAAWKVAGHGMT
jgi:hypothetical protein